jgi:hypothetical protein
MSETTQPQASTSQVPRQSPGEAGVHGPIDFVLIEFPGDQLTGEAAPALMDLVERGVIRLYDLTVISKGEDGSVQVLELQDPTGAGGFSYFAGAASGLIGDDDVREAANAMEAGTVAALIVYENSWAVPFVTAAMNSGGQLIASARIPATEVMAALDSLDPTS